MKGEKRKRRKKEKGRKLGENVIISFLFFVFIVLFFFVYVIFLFFVFII